MHLCKKEYTWSNRISHTRIDYIWVSSLLSQCSISCEIVKADCITGSDHNIVIAKVGTGINLKTRKLAKKKQLKGKKRILKIEIEQNNSKYELQIDRITETYWTKERREDIKT